MGRPLLGGADPPPGPPRTSLGSRGRHVDYPSGSRDGHPGCPTVGPVTSSRTTSRGAGDLLRQWRQRRRRSQLDLALDAGISARHLSFVETGRSRPSRGLLLALAEQLDVPLRERNTLMLAAGYAPTYAESDLNGEETRESRDALARLLAGHEPYPAVVLDRWGDVVLTNGAAGPLLEGVDAELLAAPINFSPRSAPTRVSPRLSTA